MTEITDTKKNDIKNLSFEEAMERLEKIVQNIETGRVPLENALQYYEEGTKLKKHCEKKLKSATLRVDKVLASDNGEFMLEKGNTVEE